MKFELRKITYSASLSEETSAYTADLYVDGKLLAHVSNRGHGSSDEQRPAKGRTYDDIKAANDWIKANVPPIVTTTGSSDNPRTLTIEQDLDMVCGDLLTDHLIERDLKRLLKRTVAFVAPGKKGIQSYTGKHEGDARAHLITATLRKYPGAQILNNLPLEEAKVIFKKGTGSH